MGSTNITATRADKCPVGRLAPSPTGAQHLGNARTFLVAWLLCRSQRGKLLLRIEDLDTPRTKVGATEQAIEDLQWLGLDWDESQPMTGETSVERKHDFVLQTDRTQRHREVLDQLRRAGVIYPCVCTRTEIESASSAPHESLLDGAIYPGTCSHLSVRHAERFEETGVKYAWRFRLPPGDIEWIDEIAGEQRLDASNYLGDFVVARSYGPIAYQLAVVVDDHDFGVTQVVRGNDLVYSTFRQLALYRWLGWNEPHWIHVPLVVGLDGNRLAKRHGDSRLSMYRAAGIAPETILGMLAQSLGLKETGERISPLELLGVVQGRNDWLSAIPRAPLAIDPRTWIS